MKNTFTLFDIVALKETFENASIAHDGLPRFLNSYAFEDVYETQDDSIVFQALTNVLAWCITWKTATLKFWSLEHIAANNTSRWAAANPPGGGTQ